MATEQILETGIDKLVKLLKSAGKISVAEAAKELEVDKKVIMGWAIFLEEEGILAIEYKLLNSFLTLRDTTKEETEIKVKEFNGKKEVIILKAEGVLNHFAKEKGKFKEISDKFTKLKKIAYDNRSLKNEVEELEKLEQIKNGLDVSIKKSKDNFATLKNYAVKFNSQARKEKESIRLLIKQSKEQRKKLIKIGKLKRGLITHLNYVKKKMKMVNLIANMNESRSELENELSELVKKARLLQISQQNKDSTSNMADIEKQFKDINDKKILLEEEQKYIAEIPVSNN